MREPAVSIPYYSFFLSCVVVLHMDIFTLRCDVVCERLRVRFPITVLSCMVVLHMESLLYVVMLSVRGYGFDSLLQFYLVW